MAKRNLDEPSIHDYLKSQDPLGCQVLTDRAIHPQHGQQWKAGWAPSPPRAAAPWHRLQQMYSVLNAAGQISAWKRNPNIFSVKYLQYLKRKQKGMGSGSKWWLRIQLS